MPKCLRPVSLPLRSARPALLHAPGARASHPGGAIGGIEMRTDSSTKMAIGGSPDLGDPIPYGSLSQFPPHPLPGRRGLARAVGPHKGGHTDRGKGLHKGTAAADCCSPGCALDAPFAIAPPEMDPRKSGQTPPSVSSGPKRSRAGAPRHRDRRQPPRRGDRGPRDVDDQRDEFLQGVEFWCGTVPFPLWIPISVCVSSLQGWWGLARVRACRDRGRIRRGSRGWGSR